MLRRSNSNVCNDDQIPFGYQANQSRKLFVLIFCEWEVRSFDKYPAPGWSYVPGSLNLNNLTIAAKKQVDLVLSSKKVSLLKASNLIPRDRSENQLRPAPRSRTSATTLVKVVDEAGVEGENISTQLMMEFNCNQQVIKIGQGGQVQYQKVRNMDIEKQVASEQSFNRRSLDLDDLVSYQPGQKPARYSNNRQIRRSKTSRIKQEHSDIRE